MLTDRLGRLINTDYAKYMALWRYGLLASNSFSNSEFGDILLVLRSEDDQKYGEKLADWLVTNLKIFLPQLEIELRFHRLKKCYIVFVTTDNASFIKGAELCRLQNRQFCKTKLLLTNNNKLNRDSETNSEKKCFYTKMERAMILKQMLQLIRAQNEDIILPDFKSNNPKESGVILSDYLKIEAGKAIVPTLISMGFIESILSLHDPNALKILHTTWVFAFFKQQPLNAINEYFGGEIAMYFAWLGYLTTALFPPAIFGILIFIFGENSQFGNNFEKEETEQNLLLKDIFFVGFALFNCIWWSTYLELWKRHQAELAFQWASGTENEMDPLIQDPRPAFKGSCLKPNPITGHLEPYYPAWKNSLIRYGITYPITLICLIILFTLLFSMLQLQNYVNRNFASSNFYRLMIYFLMILQALLILAGDYLYRKLAMFFNDLENYRTDEEYENFLILKIVLFQCVSAFGSLFYIAFYLKDMQKLQETLATLLITRQLTQNICEIGAPFLREKWRVLLCLSRQISNKDLKTKSTVNNKNSSLKKISSSMKNEINQINENFLNSNEIFFKTHKNDENSIIRHRNLFKNKEFSELEINEPNKSASLTTELSDAEFQSLMDPYFRTLDDYLEIFIQFGYVSLFSPAFPLAAFAALINNLFEIRVDAFKLCNTFQRPFGRCVKNIGAWQKAMEIMGIVAVIVNCSLIAQSQLLQRILPNIAWSTQILFIVIFEHIIFATKILIDNFIPDIPEWIRVENAKTEHLRRQAYKL